ncbi:MAG: hypothetical protein GXP29_12385, partial [Planctomycetes bacterium]|nr:hypothetical protein [Planctomycetota bacterium]
MRISFLGDCGGVGFACYLMRCANGGGHGPPYLAPCASSFLRALLGFALFGALSFGCAFRQPTSFPVAPLSVEQLEHGGERRVYDTDGDGLGDYRETLSHAGRVVGLGFRGAGDSVIKDAVSRDRSAAKKRRHLLIVLDSIPFRLVEEAYAGGRFRHFYPPSRVVA